MDSTYNIDFDLLWKKGYRGVMFDIDNTLVMHGAPATKQAVDFFEQLREKALIHVLYLIIRLAELRVLQNRLIRNISMMHTNLQPGII